MWSHTHLSIVDNAHKMLFNSYSLFADDLFYSARAELKIVNLFESTIYQIA